MAVNPIAPMELAELHRAVQERLGLHGALFTLASWGGVQAVRPTATSVEWFAKLATGVSLLRKVSTKLAFRYYSLARAMAGTVPNPYDAEPYDTSTVSLDRLYQEFGEVLREVVQLEPGQLPGDGADPTPMGYPEDTADLPDVDEKVAGLEDTINEQDELLNWFENMSELFPSDEQARVDDTFEWPDPEDESTLEDELTRVLREQMDEYERRIKEAEDQVPADELRVRMEREATRSAKSTAAKMADRVTEAERLSIEHVGENDPAVIGWRRVTGPNPCSFCAMIAAAEDKDGNPRLYSSWSVGAQTAGGTASDASAADRARSVRSRRELNDYRASLSKYHDNCRCRVVPIFIVNTPLTERDQWLSDGWLEATKDVASTNPRDKLNAFRRWLNQKYREGNGPPSHSIYNPATAG